MESRFIERLTVLSVCLLAGGMISLGPSRAQETTDWRLVDRLVAVVDDDPIFLSDLRRARVLAGMGSTEAQDLADRELLDRMIDRRLRLHEVERYSDKPVSSAMVETQLEQVQESVGGSEPLNQLLADSGLDRDGLRELLRRRLRVLTYIEDRIGARIFVDETQVRDYYNTTLNAEMERRGNSLPPFDDVADGIRTLLREQALNREIEQWTDELRREAQVVDLLDQDHDPDTLPPVVLELGEP